MSQLQALCSDIVQTISTYLTSSELVSLSSLMRIPDSAYTAHSRRRCGDAWDPGKRGFVNFMQCIYAEMPSVLLNRTILRGGDARETYVANKLHALVKNARCLCIVDEVSSCIAVGHDYGVSVYTDSKLTASCSGMCIACLAYVGGATLWFASVHRQLFEFNIKTQQTSMPNQALYAYDVSGPVRVAGTATGVWPLQCTRSVPCTKVIQSVTRIACWHVSGEISVYDASTKLNLYLVDTGEKAFAPHSFSIIGDTVRVSGKTWCDGRCTGRCTHDVRRASEDGRWLYTQTAYHMGLSMLS